MQDYSYLGSGKLYLEEIGGNTGLLPVGNCTALAFAVTEEVKTLTDYTTGGGGARNEVRRITGVEVTLTTSDLSPDNLARALYGASSALTATAVTNQLLGGASLGGFAAFSDLAAATPAPVIRARNGRTAVARANTTAYALGAYIVPATANGYFYEVTTAGTTAGTLPTFPTTVGDTVTDGTVVLTCRGKVLLVAGTDYTVAGNGVTIADAAEYTAGEPLEADFTRQASDVVQALVNSPKEYRLYFDGLNEARSGKPSVVEAFRVKLGAARNISLIGDDYASLELTGKLLVDTSKSGVGVSQYFTAKVAR